MNWMIRCLLSLAAAVTLATAGGCVKEMHQTIEVAADGKVTLRGDIVMPRETVEQIVRMRTDVSDDAFEMGDNDGEPGWDYVWAEGYSPPAKPEAAADGGGAQASADEDGAPITDEELRAAIERQAADESLIGRIEAVKHELETIEIRPEDVRVVSVTTFDSLEEFAKHGRWAMSNSPLSRILIEKDEAGLLKLSLLPEDEADRRQTAMMRQALTAAKFKGSLTIVLPGEIVATNLPTKEGAKVSIAVDVADAASVDAAAKLLDEGVWVTAQPAGLDLASLPLDSEELYDPSIFAGEERSVGAETPVIDADVEYTAEAMSLQLIQQRDFPEGKVYLEQVEEMSWQESPGCTINARIHAPQGGRMILSASEVKVESATDDQGREIEPAKEDHHGMTHFRSSGDDDEDRRTADFSVPLSMPAADAQAIEAVSGTVVLTTFEKWKEHRLADPRGNPQEAADISAVLDDTTMTIKSVRRRQQDQGNFAQNEGEIRIVFTGPEAIRDLAMKVEIDGFDWVNSYQRMDSTQPEGERYRRTVSLWYNAHSREAPAAAPTPTLIVRYPDGVRRERAAFTLEAMDLY